MRTIGVTEQSYDRWRSEYGGLKLEQVKRLKRSGQENGQLRKAVVHLDAREAGAEGSRLGKPASVARCRACVEHVVAELGNSERFACKIRG